MSVWRVLFFTYHIPADNTAGNNFRLNFLLNKKINDDSCGLGPMLLSSQVFVPLFPWLNFPFPCFLLACQLIGCMRLGRGFSV